MEGKGRLRDSKQGSIRQAGSSRTRQPDSVVNVSLRRVGPAPNSSSDSSEGAHITLRQDPPSSQRAHTVPRLGQADLTFEHKLPHLHLIALSLRTRERPALRSCPLERRSMPSRANQERPSSQRHHSHCHPSGTALPASLDPGVQGPARPALGNTKTGTHSSFSTRMVSVGASQSLVSNLKPHVYESLGDRGGFIFISWCPVFQGMVTKQVFSKCVLS